MDVHKERIPTVHFQAAIIKRKMILDIVHLDVCALISATSLSGCVYHVSFIHDYSLNTWIYFLKGKDEVLEKFKYFKYLIENLFENKIKTLQSHNGGEFTSN